jgi:hypothetical protein
VSFLGINYNFTTGKWGFDPSKSLSLGLQVGVGAEVKFNSDTWVYLNKSNDACRARGGR